MNDFIILSVPEVAEFNKYWLVEEVKEHTFEYRDSFFGKEDAMRAFEENPNLKLIKNEGWNHEREFIK